MRSATLLIVLIPAGVYAGPLAPGKWARWSDSAARHSASGVTVRIEPRPRPECVPGIRFATPHLTITRPGVRPFAYQAQDVLSPHQPLHFAIGKLNRGEGAAVLLDQDTGGAHCCRHLVAITPARSGWRVVDLGSWDGTPPDFLRDLSGDGRGDLVLRDDRFNYAFTSYAAS